MFAVLFLLFEITFDWFDFDWLVPESYSIFQNVYDNTNNNNANTDRQTAP